jgi:hypothetical protein
MAEIIDLNINIGANTTDFEGALTKAENLLKQFEGALKKATNVGEINYLNTQIKGLQGTISGIKNQMSSVAKPTADATNALSNLSRVAQDAPYGFIGIANNLNPLLESFQRLKDQSGSSSTALKAMVAGLTGPAGIGLALGVVSSLAVTYSKEISAFFKGPTDELKKFREELNKLNADIYKVAGEAQSNRAVGINLVDVIVGKDQSAAKTALKSLQDLYKESADIQNAKLGQDRAYYTNLVNLASLQELAIGKEANNEDQLKQLQVKRKQLLAQRNAELKEAEKLEAIFGFPKAVRVSSEKMRVGIKYDAELANLDKLIAEATIKNKEFVRAVSEFETPDSKKPSSPIVNYAREENKQLTLELAKMKALREKMKSIGLEPLKLFELPSETRAAEDKRKGYFEKQAKDLLEESNKGGFGAYMQGLFKKDKNQIDAEAAEKKRIEELTKTYEQFAGTISQTVTGALFSMYDAMQEGASAGEALGQMFSRLLRQITEMVVQAAIFAGIMSLISGGASNAAKGGVSFMGAFTKILGIPKMASGGIATGPTLAMIGEGSESEAVLPLSKLGNIMRGSFNVGSMNGNSMGQNGQFVLRGQDLVLAMQRSNSSLNIIRG